MREIVYLTAFFIAVVFHATVVIGIGFNLGMIVIRSIFG